MFFFVDLKALALVAICALPFIFLWRWRKGFIEPYIAFSDVQSLLKDQGRLRWAMWPPKFMWAAFFCFLAAFIDPHLLIERKGANNPSNPPTEGIAIYIILDQSGSMKEQVFIHTQSGDRLLSKIDIVKQVTKQFIEGDPKLGLQGRPNDMIGLIFFARAARVMAPLTLDHNVVLQQLAKYNVIGIMDQDGTSIGYAIYKAANLMAATRHYSQELAAKGQPAYIIKSNVILPCSRTVCKTLIL